MKDLQEENIPEGVAIIGMVGRFPGAQSVETFWQNICDGTESIIRLAPDEDYTLILDPTLRNNPQYVPAGAFLDHIDLFDAAFLATLHARPKSWIRNTDSSWSVPGRRWNERAMMHINITDASASTLVRA